MGYLAPYFCDRCCYFTTLMVAQYPRLQAARNAFYGKNVPSRSMLSALPMLADIAFYSAGGWPYDDIRAPHGGRPSEGLNVLFGDTHVLWQQSDRTWATNIYHYDPATCPGEALLYPRPDE